MTQIAYWDGIIANDSHLDEFAKTLQQLADGSTKSAHFKLMRSHIGNIYSARTSREQRLFFTDYQDGNKRYLILLEVIDNHDIDGSKVLNGSSAALDQYVQKVLKLESTDVLHFSEIDEMPIPALGEAHQRPKKFRYYKNQLIVFNEEQESAQASSLPLLVNGVAGSGKTCIALSILKQLVATPTLSEKPVLYITSSEYLIREITDMWADAMPLNQQREVEFKTYAQMLEHIQTPISKIEFEEWVNAYKVQGKNRFPEELLVLLGNSNQVRQEFRIICAYSEEQYLTLGRRQSLFTGDESRRFLFAAYQSYRGYLVDENKIDIAFESLPQRQRYAAVVSDESQDFSYLQLESISQLAEAHQTVLCFDPHQIQHDSYSIGPFMKTLFPAINQVDLPVSYRCPRNILTLANEVIRLKYAVCGGKVEKTEMAKVVGAQETTGRVEWLSPNAETLSRIKAEASKPNVVIVTTDEHLAEAEVKFPGAIIFTTTSVKGLEFATIITYRLFDNAEFSQANAIIKPAKGEKFSMRDHINRAKDGESNDGFRPQFNQVYTAFTRAQSTLLIYQESRHGLRYIIQHLKDTIENLAKESHRLDPQNANKQETPEQWLAMASYLMSKGEVEKARNICRQHLDCTQPEVAALLDENSGEQEIDSAKNEGTVNIPGKAPKKSNSRKRKSRKSPPKKKVANPKPVKNKTNNASDNIIHTILNSYDERNLKRLFEMEDFDRWMFESHPDLPIEYECLLIYLLTCRWSQLLNFFHCYQHFLKHFTAEAMFKDRQYSRMTKHSLFYELLVGAFAKGYEFIGYLLVNEILKDEITPEHIYNDNIKPSLLIAVDISLFSVMVDKNRELLRDARIINDLLSFTDDNPPLIWEVCLKNQTILTALMMMNPSIVNSDDFVRAITYARPSDRFPVKTTVLSQCLFAKGSININHLLNENPELVRHEALVSCLTQPLENYSYLGNDIVPYENPLRHLFGKKRQVPSYLLMLLTNHNPDIYKNPSFLRNVCSKFWLEQASVFHMLSLDSDNQFGLYYILQQSHTAEMRKLILAAFCEPDKRNTAFPQAKSIHYLLANDDMKSPLEQFFRLNPGLEISREFIINLFIRGTVIKGRVFSPFEIMLRDQGFRVVLYEILQANPKLINDELFHRFLLRTDSEQQVDKSDCQQRSLLYLLLNHPEEDESLMPEFVSFIKGLKHIQYESDYLAVFSEYYTCGLPFPHLVSIPEKWSRSQDGIDCLLLIMMLLPELDSHGPFIAVLITEHYQESGQRNTPILNILDRNPIKAAAILSLICNERTPRLLLKEIGQLLQRKNSDGTKYMDILCYKPHLTYHFSQYFQVTSDGSKPASFFFSGESSQSSDSDDDYNLNLGN